jgi:hypothetical protein
MLALENLDRRVGEVLRWVGDRLNAVLVGTPAPASADHIDYDEGAVVRMTPAEANHRVPTLSRRGHDVRNDLRQRPEHGVNHAIAGQRARRPGGAEWD